MATIVGPGNLSSAQTGNGDSQNLIQKPDGRAALLRVANTGGATPTVTWNLQGSINGGADWFNIPYATVAAPGTLVSTAVTVTTTAVNYYYLPAGFGGLLVKLVYNANTNETMTADLFW